MSILIAIVAESVINSAETMARMSSATANSSLVNPYTTVPQLENDSGDGTNDYTALCVPS